MTDTISWLELAWALVVFAGVVASTRRVITVTGDLIARKKLKRNGVMLLQVKNDLRVEFLRLVVNILLAALVIDLLTLPSGPIHWNVTTVLFTAVFTISPTLRAIDSWRTEVNRHKILRMLEEKE